MSWKSAVKADGSYAGDNLWGSIVEEMDDGKIASPAGWGGVRWGGRLADGATVREPKDRAERRAIDVTKHGSDSAIGKAPNP